MRGGRWTGRLVIGGWRGAAAVGGVAMGGAAVDCNILQVFEGLGGFGKGDRAAILPWQASHHQNTAILFKDRPRRMSENSECRELLFPTFQPWWPGRFEYGEYGLFDTVMKPSSSGTEKSVVENDEATPRCSAEGAGSRAEAVLGGIAVAETETDGGVKWRAVLRGRKPTRVALRDDESKPNDDPLPGDDGGLGRFGTALVACMDCNLRRENPTNEKPAR